MGGINLIILVCAGLVITSVFTSVLAFRAGAPLLLLFLAIGLLAGRDGPGGITLADAPTAFLIGNAALAIILFDSGFHTSLKSVRLSAAPAAVLATAGVVVTAALITLPAHGLLGLDWPTSLLLGAILSSTDAAALFFLLRVGGITLRDRVRSTLEIESGTNDPVAASLSVTLVAVLGGNAAVHAPSIVIGLALQMGGGLVAGVIVGIIIVIVVNRVHLEQGLYPVAVLGLVVVGYALTNLLDGSGFLAAYLAGLLVGNARLQAAGTIRRFQEGISWLSQIGMFVALGLLARPSHFPAVALTSAALAAILTLVARPVAVLICLLPFRFSGRERVFVSWVGLRGAVSILLSMVPLMGGLPMGEDIFEITFMVVVVSLAVQGWTVRPLARWLGLIVPEKAGPVERAEVDLPGLAGHELVTYRLHPESPLARGRPLPRWVRPLWTQRSGQIRPASRRFLPGDSVALLATPPQIPDLDRLFGRARDDTESGDWLSGDFAIGADVALEALADAYGLSLPDEDRHLTVADLFRREFRSDLEVGDHLRLGDVELIVRDMTDNRLSSVGIALDPSGTPPTGWERFRDAALRILGQTGAIR
ncbi:MAG: potassium/proton antiporter [Telmatospirillum sp.]|nr:potassium/proton antiporter [Telmatospirillum sp.]